MYCVRRSDTLCQFATSSQMQPGLFVIRRSYRTCCPRRHCPSVWSGSCPLQVIAHALGTHTQISRVQGNKLKAKHEIRIATLFKDVPDPFLKMITVHELAHLKERNHDKPFYQLCTYMEPDYHQLEFDVRLYLTYIDASGKLDWPT